MSDDSTIIMGPNQWGKAEVRVVHVQRTGTHHDIQDLNISSRLHGDLDSAHVSGDNVNMTPTDTQKNTIYAFAKDGIGSPEEFLLRLGKHFVAKPAIAGGRWDAELYTWKRILVDGVGHDHSFVRAGTETRTTALTMTDKGATTIISGLKDLVVLKSSGSQFTGFPVDKYTTLPEATDRILATSVTARWRYNTTKLDFNATFETVRDTLLEVFATHYSMSLQNSLYAMGKRVLEKIPEIDEIRFSMPNKHHFTVDLSPFGLENENEVFFAADRPYGIIEGSVIRDGVSAAPEAWAELAGFC